MIRPIARLAVLLLALSLSPLAYAAAGGASVTLNLKDADINALITTVSEVTGKNFVVDPRVKGKVTVISSSPMDPSSLYATFLSVLEVQGFTAIPSGQVIKIVPVANAREEAGGTSTAGVPRDQIVTEVFNLQNASAPQLVPILRPLVPQWGHLAAYAPNNILIVADRAANIQRLAQIIADIDQSGDQGLDVVPLKYAAADDVARILGSLAQQSKQIDPTAHPPAILTDTRTNSVLIAGDRTDRVKLLDAIKQLDVPTQNSGDTQVVYLHYADAEKLAPILQGYAQQGQSAGAAVRAGGAPSPPPSPVSGGGGANGVNVIADKDTNALIITAPPKAMQLIRHIIAQLDIRRAQVLVDGIIAEVSANKTSELGLDSVIFNPNNVATANILNPNTLQTVSGAATTLGSGGRTSTSSLATAAAGLIGQGITAAAGTLSSGGTSFLLLLRALKGDGDTNILSTPSLVTL
ncbi:MAG: type II secretion system secretin GspD, partial [Gammaproteobacteria bacterium]|nr:type II secretion system secretin GspD [Gammaproteobacteria bacterium]